jgi:hypothetical protein
MKDHRVRLTDDDLALIAAALNARRAMTRGLRRHRIERLYERLFSMSPGNPKWALDEYRQTREDELDGDDVDES